MQREYSPNLRGKPESLPVAFDAQVLPDELDCGRVAVNRLQFIACAEAAKLGFDYYLGGWRARANARRLSNFSLNESAPAQSDRRSPGLFSRLAVSFLAQSGL